MVGCIDKILKIWCNYLSKQFFVYIKIALTNGALRGRAVGISPQKRFKSTLVKHGNKLCAREHTTRDYYKYVKKFAFSIDFAF